jgi:predicted nucleic acid-binding protein
VNSASIDFFMIRSFCLTDRQVAAAGDVLMKVPLKSLPQSIFFLWRPCLQDPKDDMILELAVAAGCEGIVTHNQRDFAGAERLGIKVFPPKVFLRLLEESR